MKKKRTVDKELLKFITTIPCLICHTLPSDPDHITTRGAGGNDEARNVWPLCREHHTERHKIGLGSLIKKYMVLETWLVNAGREDILAKYFIG
jgi:hypothetical protein